MKSVKVVWHKKNQGLSQVASEGLEYAFVSKNYEQIHQLVWCKDFLQDVVNAHVNNRMERIFGFEYNPSIHIPLYRRKTRIMVTSRKDKNFSEKILNSLNFINQIEHDLCMSLTTIRQVVCPPIYRKAGVFLLDGSSRWMKAPPLISFYSLMIRVGLNHYKHNHYYDTICKIRDSVIDPYYSSDRNTLSSAKKGIEKILKYGDKLFHKEINLNYPSSSTTYNVHNRYGIVGYSNEETISKMPYWHRNLVSYSRS